jgi:hypothetical protein
MFLAGKLSHLKAPFLSWRDNKARPLAEAARLAQQTAAAEHLPISGRDPAAWHAEAMLKTVPVYGQRDGRSDRVACGAKLDPDTFDAGDWHGLEIRRSDFRRYLDWLRSMW